MNVFLDKQNLFMKYLTLFENFKINEAKMINRNHSHLVVGFGGLISLTIAPKIQIDGVGICAALETFPTEELAILNVEKRNENQLKSYTVEPIPITKYFIIEITKDIIKKLKI